MMTVHTASTALVDDRSIGPWDHPALAKFREWEPPWVDQCLKMSADPWTSGVLPRKDVELISIAVNAACTNLSAEGTRRHIRGALEAGATRVQFLLMNWSVSSRSQNHNDPQAAAPAPARAQRKAVTSLREVNAGRLLLPNDVESGPRATPSPGWRTGIHGHLRLGINPAFAAARRSIRPAPAYRGSWPARVLRAG